MLGTAAKTLVGFPVQVPAISLVKECAIQHVKECVGDTVEVNVAAGPGSFYNAICTL